MLAKRFLPIGKSLLFVGSAAIVAACNGGTGSQMLPSPGSPSLTAPDAAAKTVKPMAAATPSFAVVQKAHAGGTYSSTVNVQLSKAPVAGDVLVLFFEQNKTAKFPYSGQVSYPTAPTGSQWSFDGGSSSTAILHHVVQSGETGSYTLNVGGTGSGHEDYMVAEISGASTSNPVNALVGRDVATGTKSFTLGSGVTPTAANTFPVAFFSAHEGGLTWSSIATGWTIQDRNSEYTEALATGPMQTGTAAVNTTATLSAASIYTGSADAVLLNPNAAAASPAPTATPTAAPTATPAASPKPTATPASSPAPTATPAATPAPSATPAGSTSPYTFDGVPVYTANDWYTTNLATGGSSYAVNTVDPNSAAILNNLASAFPGLGFSINGNAGSVANNTPVNTFSGSMTKYPINGCQYGCVNDPYGDAPSPFSIPWSSTFKEQGLCSAGDCHNVVLNTSTGVVWESYTSGTQSWNGSTFSAEEGSVHNLNYPLNSQLTNGTDAASLPVLGSMLFGEDASQPSINHVIAISLPGSGGSPKASGGYVLPSVKGSGHSCATNCSYTLPLGARLRLNPSKYTCPSAATNPQANKICVTLETYGAIVIDWNGNNTIYGPQMNPSGNGTNPWNATDLAKLNGIPITDFDVMTLGTIH